MNWGGRNTSEMGDCRIYTYKNQLWIYDSKNGRYAKCVVSLNKNKSKKPLEISGKLLLGGNWIWSTDPFGAFPIDGVGPPRLFPYFKGYQSFRCSFFLLIPPNKLLMCGYHKVWLLTLKANEVNPPISPKIKWIKIDFTPVLKK
jgi:hypothetical protein